MILCFKDAIDNPGEIYGRVLEEEVQGDSLREGVSFLGTAKADLKYAFTEDHLSVWGTLSAVVETKCDRCLKDIEYPVGLDFSAMFCKPGSEESEVGYYYDGDQVKLDKMLSDEVELYLPLKFLCREDCKGLCPVCGKDLNEGSCSCVEDEKVKNSPFSGLSGLFD